MESNDEERLLRSVALENAKSILRARNRAEEELVRAKEKLHAKTQELARSLAMMRATLESTTDGILVTDGAGRITDFNERFVKMWGVPREIIDERVHARILETTSDYFDDPKQFIERVDAIYNSAPSESDDVLELADGRVFERFSCIQFVEEQNVGRVWSFRDITERKHLEDTKERAAQELRQLAANLSEADRRKNEFLAMLAHELRNPLAPIRNALQILRMSDTGGSEVLARASQMMERQVNQLVRLVDDLLDVSRISRGKIELRRDRVELNAIISQAVETAQPSCETGGVEISAVIPDRPVYIDGDADRMVQAIGNLINNSCKFTEKGGNISVVLKHEDEQAVIGVMDNGVGLDPHQIPYIFDMFVQVDSSLERAGSGLGIGLTLVKTLVQLHGGTVEAHSAGIGTGSEFVVRLPIASEQPNETSDAHPAADDCGPEVRRRILVVDDNIDSAESMAMLLQITGNEVRIAHDGRQAVDMAREFCPQVILLDIGLPVLNGFEAAREIRLHSWGREMILIALTGWGQEEDRQRSREAGFDDHLVKPVDHTHLLQRIEALIAGEVTEA